MSFADGRNRDRVRAATGLFTLWAGGGGLFTLWAGGGGLFTLWAWGHRSVHITRALRCPSETLDNSCVSVQGQAVRRSSHCRHSCHVTAHTNQCCVSRTHSPPPGNANANATFGMVLGCQGFGLFYETPTCPGKYAESISRFVQRDAA